ncbi:MAG TPA: hypothetical protein VJB90_05635 [Candidatus Nanoarchaeia archaeon]|nr:hypothetical protein [Candidatus Nanoarchaeia archaeon]
MNCELCKKKVSTTFLEKPIGTYIKNEKGKRILICFECQKKFKTKKEIIDALTH